MTSFEKPSFVVIVVIGLAHTSRMGGALWLIVCVGTRRDRNLDSTVFCLRV